MAYLGSWKIDDALTFYANTHRFDTGAATDADSVPSYRVYENETATPLLTGSMALIDSSNTAGFYSEAITLSAANGFEKGKCYAIYIAATVNSVAGATHHTFQLEAEVDANTISSGATEALSDIESSLVIIKSDIVILTSDTTAIHSDTTHVHSDTTAIHTQTTTIASDLVIVASDLLQVYSDTTIVVSDTTAIHSDTTAIHTQTTTIASDLVIVGSDLLQVYSDTTIIASDLVQVYSDTTAIHSDTTAVHSDTTAIHLQTTTIASDLVQVYSDTTVIASDVSALEGAVIYRRGTAQAGSTSSTIVLDASASATDDFYKYMHIGIVSGTGAGQVRVCTGYTGVSQQAEIAPAWDTTPNATSVFVVLKPSHVNVQWWSESSAQTSIAGIPSVDIQSISGDSTAADNLEAMFDGNGYTHSTAPASRAQATTIASDLVQVYSDTTAVHSDTTAIHLQTTTIASDVVLLEGNVSDIESSLVIVKSDLVITTSDTTAIESELILVHSETTVVQSDVALLESAHAEPAGVPAANESPLDKLGYLFMALRNQVDVTATAKTFYDDGGTAEWKKTLSDNGTTYSETEGTTP